MLHVLYYYYYDIGRSVDLKFSKLKLLREFSTILTLKAMISPKSYCVTCKLQKLLSFFTFFYLHKYKNIDKKKI